MRYVLLHYLKTSSFVLISCFTSVKWEGKRQSVCVAGNSLFIENQDLLSPPSIRELRVYMLPSLSKVNSNEALFDLWILELNFDPVGLSVSANNSSSATNVGVTPC